MSDFDLEHYALLLVSGATVAPRDEILESIKYLDTRIIGTGYYDGVGDELLKQIVVYLREAAK